MPYAPGIQDISGQLLAQGMQQRAQGFAQGFTNFIGGIEQNKRMTNDALAKFQGAVAANPNLLPFLESANNEQDPNAPRINPEIVKAFSEVKQGKTDVWNTALLANFVETYNKSAAEAQMGQMRQAQMQNLQSEMALRQAQQEKTAAETNLLLNPVQAPVYTREELEQLYPNEKWDVRVKPTKDRRFVTLESASARAPETTKPIQIDVGNEVQLVDQNGRVIQRYPKGSPIPVGFEMVREPGATAAPAPASLPQFLNRGSMLPGAEQMPEAPAAAIPSMAARIAAPAAGGMRLQPIPGGPAAQEQASKAQQEVQTQQRQLRSAENVKAAIENIRENLDKKGALGIEPVGMFAGSRQMVSQAAVNIDEAVKTIEANIGFDELRDLKSSGTTLGQVAVRELENLQKLRGSLSREQDKPQFKKNLSRIESQFDDTVRRLQILNNDYKSGLTEPSPQYFKAGGMAPAQVVKLGWSAGSEPGAGKLDQPASSRPQFRNPADQQAYEWAKTNPADPRSARILQKLGM